MNIIKAPKLNKGDLIGFISPSSPVDNPEKINRALQYFEKMGYRVKLSKNLNKSNGYLAGTDEERVEDIHSMFRDKEVKAVLSIRGGYGASRLLDKLNYNLIKKNPKIFCGYSDVTVLQNAIFRKTGLITFAGPMAVVDFCNEAESYTEESFWQMLTQNKVPEMKLPEGEKLYSLYKGKAAGRIIGGNLSLFVTLLGTKYIPDPIGSLLFLEEVSESPYRIDRMFSHLYNSGYLHAISGIVFGSFSDCVEKEVDKKTLNLGEVFEHYFTLRINKPAIYNYSHGHLTMNATLPIGVNAAIDADNCSIKLLESPLA